MDKLKEKRQEYIESLRKSNSNWEEDYWKEKIDELEEKMSTEINITDSCSI